MRLSAYFSSLLAAIALLTGPVGAQYDDSADVVARFEAGVFGFCAPFVGSPTALEPRSSIQGYSFVPASELPIGHPARPIPSAINTTHVVGNANAATIVMVAASVSGDQGPWCTVTARGVDASNASQAMAARLQSPGSGWFRDSNASGQSQNLLQFYEEELRDPTWGLSLFLDGGRSTHPTLVVASLSRSPVWREEDHPGEASPGEIAAGRELSLDQATEAAVFIVAMSMLRDPLGADPVELRRIMSLGAGTVAGVFVMHMSTQSEGVGIIPNFRGRDSIANIVVSGVGSAQAVAHLQSRFSQLGWRTSPQGNTNARHTAWCMVSPQNEFQACLIEATNRSSAQIQVERLSPDARR